MKENILIAAKGSTQTRAVVQALRGVGLAARLLPDARSTLALLKRRSPALVVLEKELPDISGLDLSSIIGP